MDSLKLEIKQLLIKALDLEDLHPDDIDDDAPLFDTDGVGLDSIDALELSLAITQSYGYQIRSDDPEAVTIFSSLRSLCQSIERHRAK